VILTMKGNCEPEVIDTIGLTRNAHDSYHELKANIVRLNFDDRTTTIEELVSKFGKDRIS